MLTKVRQVYSTIFAAVVFAGLFAFAAFIYTALEMQGRLDWPRHEAQAAKWRRSLIAGVIGFSFPFGFDLIKRTLRRAA